MPRANQNHKNRYSLGDHLRDRVYLYHVYKPSSSATCHVCSCDLITSSAPVLASQEESGTRSEWRARIARYLRVAHRLPQNYPTLRLEIKWLLSASYGGNFLELKGGEDGWVDGTVEKNFWKIFGLEPITPFLEITTLLYRLINFIISIWLLFSL